MWIPRIDIHMRKPATTKLSDRPSFFILHKTKKKSPFAKPPNSMAAAK